MRFFRRKRRDPHIYDPGGGIAYVSPERVQEWAEQAFDQIVDGYERPVSSDIEDSHKLYPLALLGNTFSTAAANGWSEAEVLGMMGSVSRFGYFTRRWEEESFSSVESWVQVAKTDAAVAESKRARMQASPAQLGTAAFVALRAGDDDEAARLFTAMHAAIALRDGADADYSDDDAAEDDAV